MFKLVIGLTEKRQRVLEIIDRLGIANIEQIVSLTGSKKTTAYYAVQELKKNGLVTEFKNIRQAVFLITKAGSEFVGELNFGFSRDNKAPNFAIFRHSMLVNESMIFYKEHLKEASFETERELLVNEVRDSGQDRRELKNLPDFVIDTEETRQAVEVELTRKTPARIKKKLLNYIKLLEAGEYTHIVYLYQSMNVRRLVAKCAAEVGLEVTFGNLDEMLGGNENV